MMSFLNTLQAAGFIVDRADPDGKWHRCKTAGKMNHKNGAYKLSLCGTIGWYQDHAESTEVTTWKAGKDAEKQDPLITQARARAAAEESKRLAHSIALATVKANEYWRSCKPLRFGHNYLTAKMLTMLGCGNLREDQDGWLVVPVEIDGKIISLQRIGLDGSKRFWSGATVKGGCYILKPARSSYTVLVEGLATGLAVFQSMPDCTVIVCFDCGNMLPVAKRLKLSGLVCVAADNDYGTFQRTGKNPGIEHGIKAAELIGCGLAYPEGITGTDYADMYFEQLEKLIESNEMLRRGRQTLEQMRIAVGSKIARGIKAKMKFVSFK